MLLPGQHVLCADPASTSGYRIVPGNTNLSAGAFGVQASCAVGYEGAALVTPCDATGPYALSGCTAIVCTDADAQDGYAIGSSTNLDLSNGLIAADVACAVGYGPGPIIAACTASGAPYTLSGCERLFCSDSDCGSTQELKDGAASTLPALGVATSPEICCDKREGYCALNNEDLANHTELFTTADGEESYQVPCGPGYAEKSQAPAIRGDTRSECCDRVFCTAAVCLDTQMLVQGSELLPSDGIDATAGICCKNITGMCGGNFDASEDFDPAACYPWTSYRTDPNKWPYEVDGKDAAAQREACCGMADMHFFMFLGGAALFGCCFGVQKGKILHATNLDKVEQRMEASAEKKAHLRRKRNRKKKSKKQQAKLVEAANENHLKFSGSLSAAVDSEDFEGAIALMKKRDMAREELEDLGQDTPWKESFPETGTTTMNVNPLMMGDDSFSEEEDVPSPSIKVDNPMRDEPAPPPPPEPEPEPAPAPKKEKKSKKNKKENKKKKDAEKKAATPAPVPVPTEAKPTDVKPKAMTDEELKAAVKAAEQTAKDHKKHQAKVTDEFGKRFPNQHMKAQGAALSADKAVHKDARKLAAKAHAAATMAHTLEEHRDLAQKEAAAALAQSEVARLAKEEAEKAAEVNRLTLAEAQEAAALELKAALDVKEKAEVLKEKALVDVDHYKEQVASLQAELKNQQDATTYATNDAAMAEAAAIGHKDSAKEAKAALTATQQRIELDAEQKIAAAERSQCEALDKLEQVEANMQDLEKELLEVKTADEALRPAKALLESATGKIATAKEEERKWKASAMEARAKLKEQEKVTKVAAKQAEKDAQVAK